jgi:hypothetical protein
VLTGITAKTAAAHHPQLTHSAWALVNHLAVWAGVVADRITEWRPITEPDVGNFPPVTDTSDRAWAAALDDLDRQHRKLLGVVSGLDAAKLDATVPGKDYPVAVMLHGTAQHFAYHAGQIAMLKKLATVTSGAPGG